MEGSQGQEWYFSWIYALYMFNLCVYLMRCRGIRAWLQQGRLALGGPICTVPFHIAYVVAAA